MMIDNLKQSVRLNEDCGRLETPSVEPPPVTKGKDWENQLIGPWVLC